MPNITTTHAITYTNLTSAYYSALMTSWTKDASNMKRIISIFCILGMANFPLDHSPKLFSQKQTIYFAQNILTDHCSLPLRFHINSI